MNFDIQSDNEDVESMVEAAKYNRWNTVYEILNRKPYLINCIPEDRAWSALHQAVYYENENIVSKLLDYKTCDAIVKSKQCRDDQLPSSSTPIDLAKSKRNNDIEILLKQHIDTRRHDRFKDDYPQYKKRDAGQDISEMGFPLLVLGVVMYKNSLLYPHVEIKKHSVELLKKIFDNERHNWELVKNQLYQALYGHCRASAGFLKDALVDSELKFFRTLISLYTTNHVYEAVNLALKQEFNQDYKPTGENLSLGLYALLLDITLTYWTDLKKVKSETYRGIPICYLAVQIEK